MILLRVTYRVRAHHMADFERIFAERVLPLVKERKLAFRGIWRTLVGNAGEYLELWEFASMADFDRDWSGLLGDPRLQEIFKTTGPMVEDENFSLLQPLFKPPSEPPPERFLV